MNYNIAVIPGDGIGPEVIDESIKILNKIGEKYNHTFEFEFLQAVKAKSNTSMVILFFMSNYS